MIGAVLSTDARIALALCWKWYVMYLKEIQTMQRVGDTTLELLRQGGCDSMLGTARRLHRAYRSHEA